MKAATKITLSTQDEQIDAPDLCTRAGERVIVLGTADPAAAQVDRDASLPQAGNARMDDGRTRSHRHHVTALTRYDCIAKTE